MTTIIKLASGVEIVGDIEINNNYNVVLNKPLQINYRYVFGATPAVSFVRYIMFADSQSVSFNKEDIMHMVTPRQAFVDYYQDVVDDYYDRLEKIVDAEFEACLNSTTQEKYMKDILEMMPIDNAPVN